MFTFALTLVASGMACADALPASQMTVSGDTVATFVRTPLTTPHGTVLLVDGIPPGESGDGLGVSRALCEAGWRVVSFQPPGTWSSTGSFTLNTWITTIGELAENQVGQVAVLGHSAGGLAVMAALGGMSSSTCIAVSSTPNGAVMLRSLTSAGPRAEFEGMFDRLMGTAGPARSPGGASFLSELDARRDSLEAPALAAQLAHHRVLFVAGSRDELVPAGEHLAPLRTALEPYKGDVTFLVLDDDHNFAADRNEYITALTTWLSARCDPSQEAS